MGAGEVNDGWVDGRVDGGEEVGDGWVDDGQVVMGT